VTRAFAVTLVIPDNEAFTAYETLARLGIPVARVQRSDIWLFESDAEAAGSLAARVREIETVYNPNKHRLAERTTSAPEPGEVWVAAREEAPMTQIAGRRLPGVTAIRRRTAWRLFDDAGRDLSPADRDRAVATFLCNPAFQVAIT
jgi:hypothetical protein